MAGMATPRVFLNTHHEVNASALGQHKPILLLHSALIDQFTEAQLRAVVAHELGHIKCQHTFYKVVAHKFAPIAAIAASVPGGSLVAMALQWHMNDWSRKAELSADRFGLLVTDDLDTVQTMLIQLAGGSSIVAGELSADEFRQQADEFRTVSRHGQKPATSLQKIEYYATELILNPDLKTHPWPAIRFVELEQWAQSRQYADLRAGNLAEAEKHPFQYMPDTVDDDELDVEAVDGQFAAPVLRQAAEEVAGKFKNWSAKLSASTSGPAAAEAVPQGWYADPQNAGQLRWWDGANWGSETRPQ
ncbi:M48 family metalloprotease [Mycobacterium adipatum]|uniref:M48 family metalloprotease n=1 Tax=Mycobacterium adipatum TaxID=1682113 RepID=UPI0034E08950